MGYKLWSSNELLTASDVNTYLMKQSVIAALSGSKPSSPTDGMLVFETDTERYVCWNATAGSWRIVAQTIDTAHTPTLTAATTNPTLGSGGGVNGRYTLRNGIWCELSFTIKFGSSGAAAGTGAYLIALPFTSANDLAATSTNPYCGACHLFDSSGPSAAQGMTFIAPNSAFLQILANNFTVGAAVPWTWSNLDAISGSITYRTNL